MLKWIKNLFNMEKSIERKVDLIYYNIKNKNNRIYLKKDVDKCLVDLNDRLSKYGVIYGELGHPETYETNFGNISHYIKDFISDDYKLSGTVKTLSTSNGKLLSKNIDNFVFRSRSCGEVNSDGYVELEKIFSFDAILKENDSFNITIEERLNHTFIKRNIFT